MTAGAPASAALIGWQTLLADLSLILFMVTAASMSASSGSAKQPTAVPKMPCAAALGEPLAVWRAGGSQTLGRWLAAEQPDARQQLTITALYRPGAQARAVAAAQALVGQAGAMGRTARVMIAPADGAAGGETLASLAYDRLPGPQDAGTAQRLLDGSGITPARTSP